MSEREAIVARVDRITRRLACEAARDMRALEHTERLAATSLNFGLARTKSTQRPKVLSFLAGYHFGRTADAIAEALELDVRNVRGLLWRLSRAGLVADSGFAEETNGKRARKIWRITLAGRRTLHN